MAHWRHTYRFARDYGWPVGLVQPNEIIEADRPPEPAFFEEVTDGTSARDTSPSETPQASAPQGDAPQGDAPQERAREAQEPDGAASQGGEEGTGEVDADSGARELT